MAERLRVTLAGGTTAFVSLGVSSAQEAASEIRTGSIDGWWAEEGSNDRWVRVSAIVRTEIVGESDDPDLEARRLADEKRAADRLPPLDDQ